MTDVSNSADKIDTRDVLVRIEELVTELDEVEFPEDELRIEHDRLQKLINDAAEYAGDKPEDGIFLIRATYFTQYAEELHDEISDTSVKSHDWPFRHIDWDAAANELQQDYTEIDYDGEAYLLR